MSNTRTCAVLWLLSSAAISACNCDGARLRSVSGKLELAPRVIDFGEVAVGDLRARALELRNTGETRLAFDRFVLESPSAELATASPAPASLEPGETLDVSVVYQPGDLGEDRGTLTIRADDTSNPRTVMLIGIGVAPGREPSNSPEGGQPAICASPVPLDFGLVPISANASKSLRIASCGAVPLEITSLALSSDPQHASNGGYVLRSPPPLPATLAPGESIDLEVDFSATAIGPARAWIEAGSSAPANGGAFFPIIAEVAPPCAIDVVPRQVAFHEVAPNATADRSVLITNGGASRCTVSGLSIAAGAAVFSLPNPPATPLALGPGASAVVAVRYRAGAGGGPDSGTLAVESGAAIETVALLGNPAVGGGCQLEVEPAFLDFGVVSPGEIRTRGLNVENLTGDGCFITSVSLGAGSSSDLSNTSSGFGVVLPHASSALSVTYRPTGPGTARGTLEIQTTDADTPHFSVPIFAASGGPQICVDPRLLPFGAVGGTATLDFTISACGGSDVTVDGLDWRIADAAISLVSPPALPLALAAGDRRSVTVQYRPMNQTGGDYAVLSVRSSDPANPAIDVEVTGGPEIAPTSAGRYLYYWQIPSPIGGDVMRLPLQGRTVAQPYWGPRVGKTCTGCHNASPDGRYVALMEEAGYRIVDTHTDIALSLPPGTLVGTTFLSWRPDVNASPPYQFAYDDGAVIHIASVFGGYIRALRGADDPSYLQMMPSWGADGRIAFVRGSPPPSGTMGEASWGFSGPTDIMLVDEGGGAPVPLPGASMNGAASYYPAHSPDARWIAFTFSAAAESTIAASDAHIRMVRADGSAPVLDLDQANGGDGASSYPTWSVDGAFLGFSSNRAGGFGDWDLYIAPIDPMTGADGPAVNVRQANSPAFEHAARWSR
jgi:HYDIN/CFA65/VesB family protein/ASPM-SPD-2-Hydin domain-containing protein